MRVLLVLAVLTADASAEPAVRRAMVRQLANGKLPPAELVDAERGLVWVVYLPDQQVDVTPKSTKRLCGDTAIKKLASLRSTLRALIAAPDEVFSCSNKPGPPTCTIGERGESSSTWDLTFRIAGDKLVLERVVERSSAHMKPEDWAMVKRLIAKQVDTTCK
jgi:hypothetical protein